MTAATAAHETASPAKPTLKDRLAGNADGVIEQIAREYGVSTLEVVRQLPAEHRTVLPAAAFERIMRAANA